VIPDQPSFGPVYLLAMFAGAFFCAWQGMIPGVPRWDVWCVLGVITFGGTCAMGGRWMVHEANFIYYQGEILELAREETKTRATEARQKMNDRQLVVEAFAMNVDLDVEMSGDDYIKIGNEAVLRKAVIAIDDNRQGMNLKAEHNVTHNQIGYRQAMDALASAGAVDAGGKRNKPPFIKNEQIYNPIVARAREKE